MPRARRWDPSERVGERSWRFGRYRLLRPDPPSGLKILWRCARDWSAARSGAAVADRPKSLAWRGYAPLDARMSLRATAAAGDIAEGLRRWRSWTYLAVEAVKNQYRRTVIGPWWLTSETRVGVVGLAVLFGAIFHQPLDDSYHTWLRDSSVTRCSRTTGREPRSSSTTREPPEHPPAVSMLVFQTVCVELLQFGHNLIIVVASSRWASCPSPRCSSSSIPAMLAFDRQRRRIGLWLGPTVARFRDVGPFVASVLQVMMFFTPVFWRVEEISEAAALSRPWNPFTYLLDIFRDPLLGRSRRPPRCGSACS